jgi:type II secretion system protein J
VKTRGFTLLELLIAISIFSLVALSLYAAFQSGMRAYERMEAAFDVYQALRMFMGRLAIDLGNSFGYLKENSRFKGTKQAIEFFNALDTIQENKRYLNIAWVKYELKDEAFKRTCYLGLDALGKDLEVPAQNLFPLVKDVSFEYAGPLKNSDKPYAWQEVWPKEGDLEQEKKLPLAVKVNVSLVKKDRQGKERAVTEVARIIPLALSE